MEAQAKIAEEIRMENVNQNMQTAMEYSPENFAEVGLHFSKSDWLVINHNSFGH